MQLARAALKRTTVDGIHLGDSALETGPQHSTGREPATRTSTVMMMVPMLLLMADAADVSFACAYTSLSLVTCLVRLCCRPRDGSKERHSRTIKA